MKRSMGLVRGKSDKKDSNLIALYSYRFQDLRIDFVPKADTIQRLQDLETYSVRLMKAKKLLYDSSKELNLYERTRDTAVLVYDKSMDLVEQIDLQLKDIEKQILQVIKSDKAVYENYERVTSVKGISWKTAVVLLIYSRNFSRFETAREFACYAGVAPFEYSSGTSVRGGVHVSRLANMRVKSILGMAAMSAKRFNKDIGVYYASKKEQGKSHRVIMNNIKRLSGKGREHASRRAKKNIGMDSFSYELFGSYYILLFRVTTSNCMYLDQAIWRCTSPFVSINAKSCSVAPVTCMQTT